jgi:hypothetical protein
LPYTKENVLLIGIAGKWNERPWQVYPSFWIVATAALSSVSSGFIHPGRDTVIHQSKINEVFHASRRLGVCEEFPVLSMCACVLVLLTTKKNIPLVKLQSWEQGAEGGGEEGSSGEEKGGQGRLTQ